MLVLLYYILIEYCRNLKQVKKVYSVLYSSKMTFVNESLDGLSTIKSSLKAHEFGAKYKELQNLSMLTGVLEFCLISWLEIRLNIITEVFIGLSYLY